MKCPKSYRGCAPGLATRLACRTISRENPADGAAHHEQDRNEQPGGHRPLHPEQSHVRFFRRQAILHRDDDDQHHQNDGDPLALELGYEPIATGLFLIRRHVRLLSERVDVTRYGRNSTLIARRSSIAAYASATSSRGIDMSNTRPGSIAPESTSGSNSSM